MGLGRVGKTLALYLSRRGEEFLGGYSSSPETTAEALKAIGRGRVLRRGEVSRADVVLLSTPDGEIEREAERIARETQDLRGTAFFHCSGVRPLDVLEPLRKRGGLTGVFHPLFPFSEPDFALRHLEGAYAGIEGGKFVEETVKKWGFVPFPLPEDRALYHAGAVLSAGLLVGYLSQALGIAEKLSIPPGAYLRLATVALEAVGELGLREALTGPWMRGDLKTVEKHLSALKEEGEIYELLLSRIQRILSG